MAIVVKREPTRRPTTAPRHRKHSDAAPEEGQPKLSPQPPPLILPEPPNDAEKYAYIRRRTWILTIGSLLSFPLLVLSQLELVTRDHIFWIFAPFILVGALLFTLPVVTDGIARGFNLKRHRRLVADWHPLWYPSVDVFLPVCGEPIAVLRNTWKHVADLVAAYPGPVTAWVLDDGADQVVKTMAKDFRFAYASRPNRGWYKKSGNLMYGYLISRAEYILLLDADFAPRPDLLIETLPYMTAHPDVAIVQTPQFFRVSDEQTWIERGAGAVQELFYRSIQTARSRKGGSTCVGTCAVYRRAALDQNKGMTLSEHSEDLLTGFELQRLGWRMLYVPIALSTGTCPDNLVAFMNQQYRWCSGTLSLMASKRFWRSKLPMYSRMCHISGFVYYLYTAIFNFAVPTLSVMILLIAPGLLNIRNMLFFIPVLAYSALVVPLWHQSPYRLEVWSVRIVSGWAHAFVVWDLLTGRRRGWNPTGAGARRQDGSRRLWIALIGWNAAAASVWVGLAFWRLVTMDPANMLMVFALGVFDLVIILRVLIQPRATDAT